MIEKKKTIYRLIPEERETYFMTDASRQTWTAHTAIPKDMRKLEKQGWTIIETEYYEDGKIFSMRFEAPRKCISIRSTKQAEKRAMSEEHKQKLFTGKQAHAGVVISTESHSNA